MLLHFKLSAQFSVQTVCTVCVCAAAKAEAKKIGKLQNKQEETAKLFTLVANTMPFFAGVHFAATHTHTHNTTSNAQCAMFMHAFMPRSWALCVYDMQYMLGAHTFTAQVDGDHM